MQYTDIYFLNNEKSTKHVYTLNKKILDQLKNMKMIRKEDYILYIYKNMYLLLKLSDKNKSCYRIENNNYDIKDNKMFVDTKISNIPISSFPLINNYHEVINRTIIKYDKNIEVIHDTINDNTISFIRIENDIDNANKLLKQILFS